MRTFSDPLINYRCSSASASGLVCKYCYAPRSCMIFAGGGVPVTSQQRFTRNCEMVLFVMMGIFAGYASATLYKTFKGRLWQKCTLCTRSRFQAFASARSSPSTGLLYYYVESTGAVPVASLVSHCSRCGSVSVYLSYL